ncbi:hypothetical protein KTS45_07655 [Halomicroarcula limicola]|uniref:DUF7992 domain-containing protein n=1 Tax=Haloarcula limicola TaxID=1429915 RepID=A0A8J7Y946_9EURY|nr:hypothetical protein [Halomicroarcula limicola]MBV0924078.1 hypothetical protein [Halomicroarcula limicola]
MPLDVPVPDPPSLRGPQPRGDYEAIDNPVEDPEDDYRREEIEGFLESGAWADAFEEWTTQTTLTEEDFAVVTEYDLVEKLDFYWDPGVDEVGYRAPTLPEEAEDETDLDSGEADEIEIEIDSLGRVVTEMLENDYLRRDDETFGFFADDAPEETFDYEDDDLGEGL